MERCSLCLLPPEMATMDRSVQFSWHPHRRLDACHVQLGGSLLTAVVCTLVGSGTVLP